MGEMNIEIAVNTLNSILARVRSLVACVFDQISLSQERHELDGSGYAKSYLRFTRSIALVLIALFEITCIQAAVAQTPGYRIERVLPATPAQKIWGGSPAVNWYETPAAGFSALLTWYADPANCTVGYQCVISNLRPCPDGVPLAYGGQYGYTWGLPMSWCTDYTITRTNDGSILINTWRDTFEISFSCPPAEDGWVLKGDTYSGLSTDVPHVFKPWCERTVPDIQQPEQCCHAQGNPIYPEDATKRQVEVDYTGPSGLKFERTYNSDHRTFQHNYESFVFASDGTAINNNPLPIGCYLSTYKIQDAQGYRVAIPHCFRYFNLSVPGEPLQAMKSSGFVESFAFDGTNYSATRLSNQDKLTQQTIGGQTVWVIKRQNDDRSEIYGVTGRLIKIQNRDGTMQTLTYSDVATPSAIAPAPGYLITIADAFGRSINLNYDAVGRLVTMINPEGGRTTYEYEAIAPAINYAFACTKADCFRLARVRYPDGKFRQYHWDEIANLSSPGNAFNLLTGITDENGVRYATFKYLGAKALSTEHAGGVNRYSLSLVQPNTRATVTDPLGTSRIYNFTDAQGLAKLSSITGSPSTALSYQSQTFDANGNVATRTDWNGTVTTYVYDLARNLETSRTEASGTAQARAIGTQWHATYRLPVTITEPGKVTTFTYDSLGNLLQKTVSANSASRTWTYTYNGVGQVLTATGPRSDVNDTTSYSYDGQGNLVSVANAAGQVTTLSNYDANGRVGRITDANGLNTDLTYNPRGWLTSRTVGGETTGYAYDGVGQLTQVTLPDNATITYTYDAAHRLTAIADSIGNRITYTLDAMGNRTSEQVTDPNGTLSRQTTRVYDALNRLQQITGGMQ